jgi:hemerythrin-like metal-binding protein
MAILEWDESIALHIPAIDAQHKELIGWINALNDAVQNGEGARLIDETLQKLINYVFEHFSAEEKLMLSYNFPGFTSHRQEHDYFVKKLKEIQGGFQDSDETSRKTLDFLVDWIVCHIKGTDQNYGRFILGKTGGQSV